MAAKDMRSEREALLRLKRERGLTYGDLSAITGHSPDTWRWWARRLRVGSASRIARRRAARFAEVCVAAGSPGGAWAFELEVRGHVVRVAAGFEGEALARLLAVLG